MSAMLRIDLGVVAENYRLLQGQSNSAQCAAVVKADAYGLGMTRVVPALYEAGCRWFFVATAQEAWEFSKAFSFEAKICVFNGFAPGIFSDARILSVLNTPEDIAMWRDTDRPVVLHVDTGMNRLGLSFDALGDADFSGLDVACVMSHLACAEIKDHPLNALQLARFREARAHFPKAVASLANSSGIFLGPDYHFDLLRPGVALYGGNPHERGANPMKPVVGLQLPVLQIREVTKSATVGYGATCEVRSGQKLATIAAGYADGLFRSLSNRGRAYWQGRPLPFAGRVSMDLIVLDATGHDVKTGDYVEILGPDQGIDDLAALAGTIGYEILTGLGARYERHYD